MTTINTIEDLIQLLDEKPEWLEEVRKRVLTRDVLELPDKVDRLSESVERLSRVVENFVASTNERFNATDNAIASMNERFDATDNAIASMNERFDATDSAIASMNERFDATDNAIASMNERFDATDNAIASMNERFDATDSAIASMNERFDATDNAIASMRNDIGILKAGHARTTVLRATTAITDVMGLERVRDLAYDDLRALTLAVDTSDIAANIILSFRQADLVMEATNQAGETCYVAVEISYTVDDRDADRAIRNAAFLTRFTGCPAHPVVAGVHQDKRIESRIESGEVFWHQLEARDLEVE